MVSMKTNTFTKYILLPKGARVVCSYGRAQNASFSLTHFLYPLPEHYE